jgi:hypothetical protein
MRNRTGTRIEAMTAARYLLGPATLVAACLVLIPPASAVEKVTRKEVKRVRKALVRLEDRLDVARAKLTDIDRQRKVLSATIAESGGKLRAVTTDDNRGFIGDLELVSHAVLFTAARADRAGLAANEIQARQGIGFLLAERDDKIDELQDLVIRSRRFTVEQNPQQFENWSVDGSLITYSADWQAVSTCESSGRWHIDAFFDGGLQFLPSTWIGFGGGEIARYAYQATKKQQIAIAERVLAIQGAKAWPNCFQPLPFHF